MKSVTLAMWQNDFCRCFSRYPDDQKLNLRVFWESGSMNHQRLGENLRGLPQCQALRNKLKKRAYLLGGVGIGEVYPWILMISFGAMKTTLVV